MTFQKSKEPAARSKGNWKVPGVELAFDAFVKIDPNQTLPMVVFGIKGRLVLVVEGSGDAHCAYNASETGIDLVRSGTWVSPVVDVWHHVICAYDGEKVMLWVGSSKMKSTEYLGGFTGKSYPIDIGGNLAAPVGSSNTAYSGFRGSLSAIRIWTNLEALADVTPFTLR